MGFDMEMDDFLEEQEFNKKELERLKREIMEEAEKVHKDYVDNPSDISGSVINIHENSPFLDVDKYEEPVFSGSRWKHVIKKQ